MANKVGRPKSTIITFEDAEREKKFEANRQRYGYTISNARKALGLSQEALARKIGISPIAVTNWETGRARPDLDSIGVLCQTLKLTPNAFFRFPASKDALTRQQWNLLSYLQDLSEHDQNVVYTLVLTMHKAMAEEQYMKCQTVFKRWRINGHSAAAGLSIPMSDYAQSEKVYLNKTMVPLHTDEIITVCGDSMEPEFLNGQQVFVEYTPDLAIGEIGIFVVEGVGYIKEYQGDHLHSLNPKHPDIPIPENGDGFKIIGRVLGIVPKEAFPTESEMITLREIELDQKKRR